MYFCKVIAVKTDSSPLVGQRYCLTLECGREVWRTKRRLGDTRDNKAPTKVACACKLEAATETQPMPNEDLTNLDEAEIQRQLAALTAEQDRRREERKRAAIAERDAENRRIANRAGDIMEIFQVKHTGRCNDKGKGNKNCIRCVLLAAIQEGWIDDEVKIELTARNEPVHVL